MKCPECLMHTSMKPFCLLFHLIYTCLIVSVASSAAGSEGKMNDTSRRAVRRALGAGRWFPEDRSTLRRMVDRYMDDARVERTDGRIVGAIAPHAGYVYSGKVAGYTFRAIKEDVRGNPYPETVVVLGFSHRGGFPGVALMDGSKIETPLGQATLDDGARRILSAQSRLIFSDYTPHRGEHSAENLIPFVQSILPDAELVIALMGDHSSKTVKDLVSALGVLAKEKRILVLASSDMLHDPDYHRVTKTDRKTLETVIALDYASLDTNWKPSKQIFCGIGPVLAVMRFAELQGCKKGTVLHYRNSGDDHPESRGRWVVGYSSVVFVSPE